MKRFEVWTVEFDPTVGDEIRKTRPAVIVSNDTMNKYLSTVTVVPMTSVDHGYPTRLQTNFQNNGGEIALDQIRSVSKKRLKKKIGVIEDAEAENICKLLQVIFSYE